MPKLIVQMLIYSGLLALSMFFFLYLSIVMRKPALCIFENKDAYQLCGNREADQHLCFRYTDSTIHLLPKFQVSSHLLCMYSPFYVGPGQKPRNLVFSQRS